MVDADRGRVENGDMESQLRCMVGMCPPACCPGVERTLGRACGGHTTAAVKLRGAEDPIKRAQSLGCLIFDFETGKSGAARPYLGGLRLRLSYIEVVCSSGRDIKLQSDMRSSSRELVDAFTRNACGKVTRDMTAGRREQCYCQMGTDECRPCQARPNIMPLFLPPSRNCSPFISVLISRHSSSPLGSSVVL